MKAALVDLNKEEIMKAASTRTFVIDLPTKSNFDLGLARPSSAFLLVFCLIHLLSITVEPRDHQWLMAKMSEIDRTLKKWHWDESVQLHTQQLQTIRLSVATSMCEQSTVNQHILDRAFRYLLKALQELLEHGGIQPALATIAKAVKSIVKCSKGVSHYQEVRWSSGLQNDLYGMISDKSLRLSSDLIADTQTLLQSSQPTSTVSIGGRPGKRRKADNAPVTIDDLLDWILKAVDTSRRASQDHMRQLNAMIIESWETFNEAQQVTLAKAVGLFICTAAGQSKWNLSAGTDSETPRCARCDRDSPTTPARHSFASSANEPLMNILERKPSSPVIVAVIQSYGRILTHDGTSDVLSVSNSVAGEVFKLLSSKDRDQRIAVVQILPLFFMDRNSELLRDLILNNRQLIFRHLRNMQTCSAREMPFLETSVMAYGAIGKVATQADLSLILSNLVDFLAHNNSFVVALAYREILAIATAHNQSTWQMFSPFWSTISVKVVEQMRAKPQILARLSDLLEIRDSAFLTRTQNFTIPILVARGHRDVLIQVSEKMGVQVWELLKTNMPYVLATLFTQEYGKSENGVEFMINLMAANKNSGIGRPLIDTRSLIFSSRTPLTIELLKMLGSQSDAKRERVFAALQTVAAHVMEKPLGEAGAPKAKEILKLYLQSNVLELMNHFTDIITDKKGRKTFTEKIGCIAGIQEIVRFASIASKAALPQVSPLLPRLNQIIACFQTALMDDVLRFSAIQAWSTLLENHQAADVGSMLAHMLAVFMEIWSKCTIREKDMIRLVIEDAIGRYEEVIMTDYSIPSLAGVPELEDIAKRLDGWREKASPRLLLELLLRRCNNETAVICYRGLLELQQLLTQQMPFFHSLITRETCDKLISQLLRSLLDVIAKYHDTDPSIVAVAVDCLGMVGAVDPSRTDAAKEAVDINIQHNFEDADECINFAMALVEHRLVGSFRSATDTKAQGYLAWAMQELLVFCGFTSQVIDVTKGLGADHLMLRKWGKFSKPARETLTPLLTSKYSLTTNATLTEPEYPIFPTQKTFREWLQTFTLATLKEAQGDNARKIFTLICSRIIKDQDLRISEFVLPYALINIVVSGSDKHCENILKEFLAVLESIKEPQSESESAKSRLACQSVFNFVDTLSKWLRQHRRAKMEHKQMLAKKANRFLSAEDSDEMDQAEIRIAKLLSQMPPFLMSDASFRCGSYARALFYWEQRFRDLHKDPKLQTGYYEHWQTIYSRLDEPDGIEGVSSKFTYRSFDQQILEHETAGHWSAAQSCFEMELETQPEDLELQKGLLNSIKQTGHHEIYLRQIQNLMSQWPAYSEVFSTLAIESAWMTQRWDELTKFLNNSERSGFEYFLGRTMLALYDGNEEEFNLRISEVRRHLGDIIVASGTDSTRQCYDALVKLHAVQDLKALTVYMRQDHRDRRASMKLLDERLEFMIPIPKYQQFALAVRRAAINALHST
jgi:serine/threonine-protein kinase ATR